MQKRQQFLSMMGLNVTYEYKLAADRKDSQTLHEFTMGRDQLSPLALATSSTILTSQSVAQNLNQRVSKADNLKN
jgi:hypothetical protein